MKDRVYMVLGFFGFVIIVVIIALNYNRNSNVVYEIESSYTPEERSDLMSTQELYNQLTGARELQCPNVALSKPDDTLVTLGTIWGSYRHPYSLNNLFLTTHIISDEDTGVLRPMADDYRSVLSFTDKVNTRGEVLLSELFSYPIFAGGEYIEIVAPFGFIYGNLNSDIHKDENGATTQDIVVVNSSGNCRITFGNVANWMCAGPIGTTSVKSANSDGVVEWEDHYLAHHSVIGNSANAAVRGGSSGSVVGYAKQDTTVKVEVFLSGSWSTISVNELILPTVTS